MVKIRARSKGGRRNFAVVYVPPKTGSWAADKYEKMIDDTKECL